MKHNGLATFIICYFSADRFSYVGGYSAKTTIKEEIKMAKRGKKYLEAVKLIDRSKAYPID